MGRGTWRRPRLVGCWDDQERGCALVAALGWARLVQQQGARNAGAAGPQAPAPPASPAAAAAPAVTPGAVLEETPGVAAPDLLAEDDISADLWLQVLKAPAVVLADLTPNFRAAHEAIKTELITGALLTTPGSSEETQAWWRLLLVDKLLFHKGGDPGESLNAKLRQRLRAVQSGEWLDLIAELLDRGPGLCTGQPSAHRCRDGKAH